MERDAYFSIDILPCLDFNSHAHVERDNTMTNHANGLRISTHTLTWSVTRQSCVLSRMPCDFNSHAHVERDRLHWLSSCWKTISTHTLTWSVTRQSCVLSRMPCDFNSHAHVERDPCLRTPSISGGAFQLTRSRGA